MEVFGDGTEFAISVATLGISHPPSYPLHVTLAKLFYFLPVGNIAFRVNLFSSITAALGAFTAYKFFDGDKADKWFLGLTVFFSRSFFVNAMTGEVYALNLLFFLLILFLLQNLKDIRFFYLAMFLLGLGAGNHHTILFLIFYITYIFFKKKFDARGIITSLSLFILGFSIYLYLPLRAVQNPLWNWGNPKNFELLINNFFRHDFKPEGMSRDLATLISQVLTINPFYEFGLIAALIFIAGTFMLYKREKRRFYETLFLLFLYSIFIVILLGKDTLTPDERKETYAVFFIPAYFLMVFATVSAIKKIRKEVKIAIFSLCLLAIFYNQSDVLRSFLSFDKNAFPHDLARAKLSSLPKNSVLILEGGEHDFPIMYQQIVCKFKEDTKVVNLTRLGKRWNAKESLEVGTTYTKGFEGESNSKRSILKAVMLFQKEFKNRRVFLNIFDDGQLPETLKYTINGLYYEFGGDNPITLDLIRERSLKGAPQNFAELIKAAKDVYESRDNQVEVQRATILLQKLTD